jgi:hypothetical protein
MGWATFWANSSQARLVTLLASLLFLFFRTSGIQYYETFFVPCFRFPFFFFFLPPTSYSNLAKRQLEICSNTSAPANTRALKYTRKKLCHQINAQKYMKCELPSFLFPLRVEYIRQAKQNVTKKMN